MTAFTGTAQARGSHGTARRWLTAHAAAAPIRCRKHCQAFQIRKIQGKGEYQLESTTTCQGCSEADKAAREAGGGAPAPSAPSQRRREARSHLLRGRPELCPSSRPRRSVPVPAHPARSHLGTRYKFRGTLAAATVIPKSAQYFHFFPQRRV